MAREQLTPKSKAIAELKDENRGLKRSVSKMLSFNERLMDEQDALLTDQAALEEEWAFLSWGSQTQRQSWIPLSIEWKKLCRH